MAQSLVPVAFAGATLHAVVIDGIPYVSLRSICDALGLAWHGQWERIKRHAVLSATVRVSRTVADDGKDRELVVLPLDKLNGWLFGVSARRVRPELRERLVQYQRECFDVLAAHFGARPAPGAAQLQAAVEAAARVGAAVQQAVLEAVLREGADWRHARWELSFVDDSARSAPPVLRRLGAGAVAGTWPEIVEILNDPQHPQRPTGPAVLALATAAGEQWMLEIKHQQGTQSITSVEKFHE